MSGGGRRPTLRGGGKSSTGFRPSPSAPEAHGSHTASHLTQVLTRPPRLCSLKHRTYTSVCRPDARTPSPPHRRRRRSISHLCSVTPPSSSLPLAFISPPPPRLYFASPSPPLPSAPTPRVFCSLAAHRRQKEVGFKHGTRMLHFIRRTLIRQVNILEYDSNQSLTDGGISHRKSMRWPTHSNNRSLR